MRGRNSRSAPCSQLTFSPHPTKAYKGAITAPPTQRTIECEGGIGEAILVHSSPHPWHTGVHTSHHP
eukprot:1143236-Pelagomonas_calceolata.AAC.1